MVSYRPDHEHADVGSALELIIFDMDQVLCQYDRPLRIRKLAALSFCPPEEIFERIWKSGFEASSEAGEMSAAAYLAGFAERIGYPLSRSEWIEARRIAMTRISEMLALVASIKPCISVAVLTNNGFLTKESITDLFPELPALFEANLMFSAEFGARKPSPEVYRRLLAKIGVAPQKALMVDDDAINIAGAEAASLQGHVFDGVAGLVDRLASFAFRAV